jgi:hypothetical protein
MISPSWKIDWPFFRSKRSDASPGGLLVSVQWLACAQMSVAGHKTKSTPRAANAARNWRGSMECVSKGVSLERSFCSGKYKRTNGQFVSSSIRPQQEKKVTSLIATWYYGRDSNVGVARAENPVQGWITGPPDDGRKTGKLPSWRPYIQSQNPSQRGGLACP